jgi:hypothetical protein
MARQKQWLDGEFSEVRIKLPKHIYAAYKVGVKRNNITAQEDICEYVKAKAYLIIKQN